MEVTLRGIYRKGTIELLEDIEMQDNTAITVTLSTELESTSPLEIDVASSNALEREALKEERVFSIADSSFFSLPPENLGRTSADALDKIIADEAQGRE